VKIFANNPSGVVLGDINTRSPSGSSGSIIVFNNLGSVTMSNHLSVDASGRANDSGSVAAYAGRYVADGAINALSGISASGLLGAQAGSIPLSAAGAINAGDLTATASGPMGVGGTVFLVAGHDVNVGVVDTSGLALSAGGSVSITSR